MDEGLHKYNFTAMGCPCQIALVDDGPDINYEAVAEACIKEARRFEQKYSRYRDDSLLSAINNAAGNQPVAIDAETAGLLNYAEACFDTSNGLFDVTSGIFRTVWHAERSMAPTQSELDAILASVGWKKVQWNEETVFLTEPDMELDFGGLVKEYTADAMAAMAQQLGITQGIVNLGGDIRLIGAASRPWTIGVRNPENEQVALASIEVSRGAVTTSGSYERTIQIADHCYSHIINPKTGWPVEGLYSVSVFSEHAITAGSLSTIAMLKQEDEAIEWLHALEIPFFAITKNRKLVGTVDCNVRS